MYLKFKFDIYLIFLQALDECSLKLHVLMTHMPHQQMRCWLAKFHPVSLHLLLSRLQNRDEMSENSPVQHNDDLYRMISMKCFQSLQSLKIHNYTSETYSRVAHSKNLRFDCAALHSLQGLLTLDLNGYRHYSLNGIPEAIQNLSIGFGGIWEPRVLSSHDIALVDLPQSATLRTLKIHRMGVVGFDLKQLVDQCQYVEINAMFALAGIPIADNTLVNNFRRPYVEGDYVPPHILADQEAVEMSTLAANRAGGYMVSLLSESKLLKCISFSGDCARSLKVIPAFQSADNSTVSQVEFIHNVTAQALLYLFGLSGAEILDRALDMVATGRLDDKRISILIDDLSQTFKIRLNGI